MKFNLTSLLLPAVDHPYSTPQEALCSVPKCRVQSLCCWPKNLVTFSPQHTTTMMCCWEGCWWCCSQQHVSLEAMTAITPYMVWVGEGWVHGWVHAGVGCFGTRGGGMGILAMGQKRPPPTHPPPPPHLEWQFFAEREMTQSASWHPTNQLIHLHSCNWDELSSNYPTSCKWDELSSSYPTRSFIFKVAIGMNCHPVIQTAYPSA